MNNNYKFAAFVAAVVILIYFAVLIRENLRLLKFAEGLWKADPDFCAEANLDSGTVYIKRDSYSAANVATFDIVVLLIPHLTFIGKMRTPFFINKNYFKNTAAFAADVEIEEMIYGEMQDNAELWAGKVKIEMDPNAGKIIIYKENTLLCLLYKDNNLSDVFNSIQKE